MKIESMFMDRKIMLLTCKFFSIWFIDSRQFQSKSYKIACGYWQTGSKVCMKRLGIPDTILKKNSQKTGPSQPQDLPYDYSHQAVWQKNKQMDQWNRVRTKK